MQLPNTLNLVQTYSDFLHPIYQKTGYRKIKDASIEERISGDDCFDLKTQSELISDLKKLVDELRIGLISCLPNLPQAMPD